MILVLISIQIIYSEYISDAFYVREYREVCKKIAKVMNRYLFTEEETPQPDKHKTILMRSFTLELLIMLPYL